MQLLISLFLVLALAWPASAQAIQEFHIKVQVQGAVKRPGVYSLYYGSRVAELLQQAGGPRSDANLADVNLAQVLADGQLCKVPVKEAPVQLAAAPKPKTRRGSRRAKPTIHEHRMPKLKSHTAKTVGQRVHLNSAHLEDLLNLPGVGQGLASKILAQRQKVGRFHTLDDLREVPGLGQRRIEHLKPFVALD